MSGRGGAQSERDFLTKIAVGSSIVITWFLVTLAAELLGNQANETHLGQNVGKSLLIAGVIVVPLTALIWAGVNLWKWRHPAPPEPPPTPVLDRHVEPEPAAWRPPGPIHDRGDEVEAVVDTLLDTGVAVVYGARDVGTSAVAEAAVQSLIDKRRRFEAKDVARIDLRSRSSRTPDDARATAGRVLSMFRQDEPANGTPKVLANAAARLHEVLARQYAVLLLDNVTAPAEVDWLIPEWTDRNPRQPWLIIAGETAIESVVPAGSGVPIDPLSTEGMLAIWHADTDTRPRPSVSEPIATLIDACHGRPRAIKAVARETNRTNREAEVGSLLATMTSDEENPLVGIWRAILLRAEGSLSPDARWLLHALAVIPVTALAREAIIALVSAHAPDADPGRALPEAFEKLRDPGFVDEVDGRYRLPLEIRQAITGRHDQKDVEVARVAVPALVRHHADRVVRRANQLDVRSVGAAAAAWLGDEEPTLRPLFLPENYDDGEVLAAVLDDLARIAGALEYWYVREQQADGLLTVSTGFGVLADRAQRSGLSALAAARKATAYRMLGQWTEADQELCVVEGEARATTDHALGTELVTRLRVERLLLSLSMNDKAARVKARLALEETAANRRHPGAGIAMLNLGALHLTENKLAEAKTCLDEAETMARERLDTGCQAQAVELRGIALSGEDLQEAVSLWLEARKLFEAIGDEQGQGRCLQHLGAAAVVDTAVADRLADAKDLLEESRRLRAGQPDTALVDEYLNGPRLQEDENG